MLAAFLPSRVLSMPRIAIIGPRGQLQIREPTSGLAPPTFTTTVPLAGGDACALAASPNGQVLALGDPMGVIHIWSPAAQPLFNDYDIPPGVSRRL